MPSVISKLRLLVYGSLLLFTGFTYGSIVTIRSLKPDSLRESNPVIIDQTAIGQDLNLAASTLMNCPAFRTQYPEKLPLLLKLGPIGFSYAPPTASRFDGAYAATPRGKRMMYLTRLFFEQTRRARQAIIGHELMHILGLPESVTHNTPYMNPETDPIYRLTYACFTELPQ